VREYLLDKYSNKGNLTMSIITHIQRYLRRLRVLSPLSFDQQIYGAQSLMNLHQSGSWFYLAEADRNGTMYTCWQGSEDAKPYAITVDITGHATGPTFDDSRVAECQAFVYPPTLSCAQAQQAMINAGITDAWIFCRLRQTVDYRGNPFYDFTFSNRQPVHVDAVTGQITQ
jgi:hypothetical protein